MNFSVPILSITGSDNTGSSGIQADIKTISALGGHALTAITTVTVQNTDGIHSMLDLPTSMVVGQTRAIVEESHPLAVKVGLLRNPETIAALKDEIVGCRHKVMVPGIVSSQGEQLMSNQAIDMWKRKLIPEASILLTRCNEAELLLGRNIASDNDMLHAAQELRSWGADAVLLRGGHQTAGRLTALLLTDEVQQFFSSQNTTGWQRHGVGGALTAAVATRMALGDDIPRAVAMAHDYLHSQIVYAVDTDTRSYRQADLFNRFMSLVATHYRNAHDVAFYADHLSISTRYLTKVTDCVVGKSPKQVITDYVLKESGILLETSRLTISEIAYTVGFSSLPMFSRCFSAHHGCSPMEYRKNKTRL